MKLLIIAIIITALTVVLAVASQIPVTETTVTTPTNNVDDLDKELTGMEADDTSENLDQTDYQGL